MVQIIFQFFLSAVVIVIAGYFLTKFSDKIAEATGWGRLFVGSFFLAGATSLPELMVDIKAIEMNIPDLAVGDLLGSSLFNLLILSILDFSFPSAFRRTSFSPNFIHHSLSMTLSMVLTAIVGVAITSRIEFAFGGVSFFCWLLLVFYLWGLRLIFLNHNSELTVLNNSIDKPQIFPNVLGYIICATFIFFAAPFLVEAADKIAKETGIGQTFIGTTLVAFSTSLTELVATFVAFRMGALDLALGNILGSNAFNMLLFIPLDFFYPGILFNSVRSIHAVTAFCIVISMSVALMGQLYRKKERKYFAEPSSELVVLVILSFLVLLYNLT